MDSLRSQLLRGLPLRSLLARQRRALFLGLGCVLALTAASPVSAETVTEAESRACLAGLAAATSADRLEAIGALERIGLKQPALVARALPRLKVILRLRGPSERARVLETLARVASPEGRVLYLSRLDPAVESHEAVLDAAMGATAAVARDSDLLRRLLAAAGDRHSSPERRALVLEALGRMDSPAVALLLERPRKNEHWVEACARAIALGRRGGTTEVAPLLALLDHAELAPRIHAREALVALTHQRFPADGKPWRAWWSKQAGRLPARPAATAAGDRYARPDGQHVPHYYGIPIPRKGSRVVFCLDASQSMYGAGITSARRELRKTLMEFPATHEFELVVFNERLFPWRKRMVRAHPVQKLLAIRYLESIEPTSYTNLYDAVDMAFGHAGRGSRPRDPAVKLDAIFLLSDGAPNRGRHRASKRVVKGIREMSRRDIPVHTIGAGEEVFSLLMAIAKATGGEFIDAFE